MTKSQNKHEKHARNWLRKGMHDTLGKDVEEFTSIHLKDQIRVLQGLVNKNTSQGRKGKPKTLKVIKRLLLNVKRLYKVDVQHDEKYSSVMESLHESYEKKETPSGEKILFGPIPEHARAIFGRQDIERKNPEDEPGLATLACFLECNMTVNSLPEFFRRIGLQEYIGFERSILSLSMSVPFFEN